MRRAAWSVPANIVEGTARTSRRESLRFFEVSHSSLREIGYGVHAATRLGYLDAACRANLEERIRMVAAPLRGLIARYRREQ